MKWILTNHCFKRIKERDMPYPREIGLKPASRRIRKKIRANCPKEGFKTDYIYWSKKVKKETYVYVTIQEDVNKYLVLTCFKF